MVSIWKAYLRIGFNGYAVIAGFTLWGRWWLFAIACGACLLGNMGFGRLARDG